jgi:Papain-like cysteine protease AvrRpt2
MKKFPLLILLAILVLTFCGCPCRPLKVGIIPIKSTVPQHTNTWCWAASTELISDYYNHRVDQCESSKFVHNNPADCSKGCPGYCSCWYIYNVQPGCGATISQIADNWTHWKFKYVNTSAALSWDDLKVSLSVMRKCDKSPVQVIWWWTEGGGHVVTAYGYVEGAQDKFVIYYNPWAPDCTDPDTACSSPTDGGEYASATYEWMVSTADKRWGDTFAKFSYAGP